MIHIRRFSPQDYEVMADIHARVRPDLPITVETYRHFDENLDPKYRLTRWVAEIDGVVVGFGQVNHQIGQYKPDEMWMNVEVHPDHKGKGVGTAIFKELLAFVQSENIRTLTAVVREDQPNAMAFVQHMGFNEYARRFNSYLELADLDLAPFLPIVERVNEKGFVLKSLNDLKDDPERDQKFYTMYNTIYEDVPMPDGVMQLTYEEFRRLVLDDEDLLHDGTFIALHDGQYVGTTVVGKLADDKLYVQLTGVLPDYRRKGLALALKVRGIQYARDAGYKTVVVTNDPVNIGIMTLNEKLGFLREPASVRFMRHIDLVPDQSE